MLDAICIVPLQTGSDTNVTELNKSTLNDKSSTTQNITFSIFEFKALPDQKIALYRHSLFCPVCLQPAYFRRASIDGKQACFGSRHHLPDCSELNSHLRSTSTDSEDLMGNSASTGKHEILSQIHEDQLLKDQKQKAEKIATQNHSLIEKSVKEELGFVIDFSAKTVKRKNGNDNTKNTAKQQSDNTPKSTISKDLSDSADNEQANSIKQSLAKLLTSLLRGSSLATSDVWVYTSETHKWRAKNLFVKLEEAEVLDNLAPRMYWGTISYADKDLMWLNVEGAKNIAIPLKLFQQKLLDKYSLANSSDLKGARIILFAKCLANKDKSRKFLQLWSNDLQFLHLSLIDKP